MEQANSQPNELHDFIEFLFGGLNGTAYVAVVNPQDRTDWQQIFIPFPEELNRVEKVIHANSETHDVYLAPVLYKSANSEKENFKCSNVVWTEFDGNAPDSEDYFTQPSLRVCSSTSENQHVYWRLSEPLYDVNALEEINRNITYNLGADSSAWDATQVLRPPLTKNHKPEREGATVRVIHNSNVAYDHAIFGSLPQAPNGPDTSNWQLGILPDITDVILKYEFTPDMASLFKKERSELKDRSASLMNLAFGLAQMGLSDAEIFVCLISADDRWGKFKERKDRNKRLAHIITVARNKYPGSDTDSETEAYAFAFDFVTFLNTDIQIDWVIDGMLMEQGSMLMAGPSGIGKTQLTMRAMMSLALGRDFLHYKIQKPRKCVMFSLEMGFGELKQFASEMVKTLNPEDLDLLEKNLIVIPHGEKWPFNTPVGQEQALRMIESYEPDGIFIDSVGSAIHGSINDDEAVQGYLDFLDRIRNRNRVFTWAIHHMRKSTNGGHAPSSQDDVYGNQYLVNRATSVYGILRGRDGLIKIRNMKNRLAKQEDDYFIKRIDHLDFETTTKAVDQELESFSYKPPADKKGPVNLNGFDV